MKIEDAIERQRFLKNTYTNCINGIDKHKGYYKKLVDSCDMAIEALEKQMPKEPLDIDYSDPALHVGDCPNCKQAVDNTELHCDRCGQALKWSD